MDYIITTEQLTKKYKNFTSVNNVSLHIRKGSIYGFLGSNGAGKSTTMKMLLGLTAPTKGSFTIGGKRFPDDRIAILKEINPFIESPSFYANLTGRENLDIIRRILGLPKDAVWDPLDLVGLTKFGGWLAKKYSLGMKQRLGLAGALLGRPPILILDEPTNGMDPSGIYEIRNLVKFLPKLYDCTVLISSHMLSEIELMADDIGILNYGRLLIFIASLLLVASGIANLSSYFTPEYTNAWPAMFIQSALAYAYYLLPFSMIVVCVMIAGWETMASRILRYCVFTVSVPALCDTGVWSGICPGSHTIWQKRNEVKKYGK